jgi:hypothetical protein
MVVLLVLSLTATVCASNGTDRSCSWWYEQTAHHGFAFRNASAFGAIGDGKADDTAALQRAIDHNRGGEPGSDQSKAAAVVYIGPGTYKVTDTLVLWKWTVLIGNPHCPPTLVLPPATPSFDGKNGLKPLLVTTVGFNVSTAAHAWWDQSGPNAVNEHFFTSVRHLRVVIASGNPGAVAISWNVAQQTALRDVEVTAANDTAVALDLGAGADYEKLKASGGSLSAGGVVEDVILRGALIGLRVAVTQALLRNILVQDSIEHGVRVHTGAWSLVALNVSVARAPVGFQIDGTLPGAVQLLDCSMSAVAGGTSIVTDGKTAIMLQNLRTDPSVTHVVDRTLRRSASGVVPMWAQGKAYQRGKPLHPLLHRGPLPLPTLKSAVAQHLPLACRSSSTIDSSNDTHLCGGSVEDPSTGESPVCNSCSIQIVAVIKLGSCRQTSGCLDLITAIGTMQVYRTHPAQCLKTRWGY